MPEKTAPKSQLTPYLRFSYLFTDLTFSLMVTLTNTYVQIFLTNVALFPTAIAGSILFFGRILDGISAPPVGSLIEKSNLKWGKYRPWLVMGSILTLIFNILIFVDWQADAGAILVKAITCCIVYAAFCASTNLAYTGFTSLNSALANSPKERVELSSLRNQGGSIGKILAGYLLLPMIHLFGGSDTYTVMGMFITAALTSVILVIGFVNLANATKKNDVQQVAAPGQAAAQEKLTTAETFRFILTNRPLMCLFGADVLRLLAYLSTLSVFPYFFLYVAKNPAAAPMLFGTTSIAMLVGATLVRFITRVMSKRNTYLLGLCILAVSFIVANAFKSSTYIMVYSLVAGFVGYAFGSTLTTAMYADIVDYGEVKYGKNARANYFAMFQLSIKVAAIGSTGIAGFGMAAIGFQAGVTPTEQVISGINFLCLALPIGLSLGAIVLVLLYNLTDKKMDEVRAALAAKNAK